MFLGDPPPVDEVQRRTVPFLQTSYPYRCRSTENNVHRMICASRHPLSCPNVGNTCKRFPVAILGIHFPVPILGIRFPVPILGIRFALPVLGIRLPVPISTLRWPVPILEIPPWYNPGNPLPCPSLF